MNILQDLRFGFRILIKNSSFTLIAVLTLALGIGATTAIFSVVDGMFLRALPFGDQERLAVLWETVEQDGNSDWRVSPTSYVEWTQQDHPFEAMGIIRAGRMTLTGTDDPEILQGARVNRDYFKVLGVEPILGRVFTESEDQPGAGNVVLLSEEVWRRRYDSDPALLGRTISLENSDYTIIGVTPEIMMPVWPLPGAQLSFRPEHGQYFIPMRLDEADPETGRSFICGVIGKLDSGVTFEQAQESMNVIASRLEASSGSFDGLGIHVKSFREELVGDMKLIMQILFGSVGLVLLIACVNVANLLLSKASSRQQELAVRMALGAGRMRLISQMLSECLLLGLIGGFIGVMLASFGLDVLLRLLPGDSPLLEGIGINYRILMFSLVLSVFSSVLFGILPALRMSRENLREKLQGGLRGALQSRGEGRLRNALVISEVALALLMVIGAGLLVQSFRHLQQEDPGFQPEGVVAMELMLPPSQYDELEQINTFYGDLTERIENLPGVRAATYAYNHPLESNWTGGFRIQGRPAPEPGQSPGGHFRSIGLDYFQAMGIPLLKGRHFTPEDDFDHAGVMIINESLARRYFPNEDPLGQTIRYSTPAFKWKNAPIMYEIVGVVRDVKYLGVDQETEPGFYLPAQQCPLVDMNVLVAVDLPPSEMMGALREAVWSLDAQLPILSMTTMRELFSERIAQPRFTMMLMALFGVIALCLAIVGVYGLISYAVSQRTREIGLRIALGANPGSVLRQVIGRSLGLTLTGIVIGIIAALMLTRLLTQMLYDLTPTDPVIFVTVPVLLLLVAVAAAYLPARRASRIDPMTALRCD